MTSKKQPVKKAAKKKAAKAKPKKKAAASAPVEPPPKPIGAEFIHEILDERLLMPQKTAALAFDISVEALKKWRVKPRRKVGREVHYYLPDLMSYRLHREKTTKLNLNDERARLAMHQADRAQLEVEQMRGELIPAAAVLETWEPLAGAIRSKVLALPSKFKTSIPKLTDKDLLKVKNICRSALEDLSNGGIPRATRKHNAKSL